MIYDKINELNQNYTRKVISRDTLKDLYRLDTIKLFDYIGEKYLIWETPYNTILDIKHNPKFAFYVNGKLDPIHNLLGKHLNSNKKTKQQLYGADLITPKGYLPTNHFTLKCLNLPMH